MSDYEVGYGKPPKAGRFAKGRSGNPGGRPRKKRTDDLGTLHPAHHPTQAVIATEGKRLIQVKSADGVDEIPAIQVVMRSLVNQAAKGGILAIRTLIALQQEEDDRQYRLRRERYDNWREYHDRVRPLFDDATAAGKAEPELYPHPDDMEFDYANLEVRISGPIDAEGAKAYADIKRLSDFAFEMSRYIDEDCHLENGDITTARFGMWLMLSIAYRALLPPRLQATDTETANRQLFRAIGSWRRWREHLVEECTALGLPLAMLDWPEMTFTWKEWANMRRKVRRRANRR